MRIFHRCQHHFDPQIELLLIYFSTIMRVANRTRTGPESNIRAFSARRALFPPEPASQAAGAPRRSTHPIPLYRNLLRKHVEGRPNRYYGSD